MSNTLPVFTRKLIELREAAELSQYELARRSGLTRQAVSLLETGRQGPAWETVQRLALALGVDCRAFIDPTLRLPDLQPARPRGRPSKDSAAEKPARSREQPKPRRKRKE